jgi:hypothetical protein
MKAIGRAAILILLAGSAAGAAAESGSATFGAGVTISRGSAPGNGPAFTRGRWREHHGRPDGNFNAPFERRGDRRHHRGRDHWRGHDGWFDTPGLDYAEYDYRHSRTSYENGFFGQRGTSRGGVYEYDRGYPYDFYQGRGEIERVEMELLPARESWCETQRVWDDDSGRERPVRICRN